MKKTLLLLTGVALLSTVNAQDVYKQEAGNKNLEVQFAPLGGSPISMGGIRFRSFGSETTAIRLNVFVGHSSETEVTQQADDTITKGLKMNELHKIEKMTTFNIRPGFEKHMAGTDRLSPYMGIELDFGMALSTMKEESEGHYSTGNSEGVTPTVYTKTTKGKDGYMTFGGNLVAGFDWYFTKKVYLGAELGFGAGFKSKSKINVVDEEAKAATDFAISQNPTAGIKTYSDPNDQVQGKELSVGPTVNGQIRLGFLF